MLTFLAQSTLDGDFLLKAIGAMSFIASAVTAWAVLTGKRTKTEVGPQPFEVSQAAEHVSKGSFNKHLELDRKEHERDREEYRTAHKEIWAAIESFRSENSRKIEALISKVDSTAAVMDRIGDEVRDAAKTANQAANTAVTALNEAQHKRAS